MRNCFSGAGVVEGKRKRSPDFQIRDGERLVSKTFFGPSGLASVWSNNKGGGGGAGAGPSPGFTTSLPPPPPNACLVITPSEKVTSAGTEA